MIRFVFPALPALQDIKARVEDMLSSGIVLYGKYVETFEEQVALFLGVKHVIALSNCTTALLLMLSYLPKGEIIIPSFTFHATPCACTWNKLKIVYADVDPNTWTISPEDVLRKITRDTVAVMGVNIFGNPPDVFALSDICRRRNVTLLFDSAQSFGSTLAGKRIGCYGLAEAISLGPSKILTAGEGGLFVTNNDAIAAHVKAGRYYGDADANLRPRFPGLNGRMTEFQAILGLESLSKFSETVTKHQDNNQLYRQYLKDREIIFQQIEKAAVSCYKDITILVPKQKRGKISKALLDSGVQHKFYYFPCHNTTAYYQRANLPVTEDLAERVITLPSHVRLTEKDIQSISNVILSALRLS